MRGRLDDMLETSARLLRLLSLLQCRRDWTGAELAGRLGVGLRTLRRDIDRLRDLGYPVDATPGAAGGYRLGVGAALPPLLLDDEEAVAVALSLHTATTGSVAGLEETSLRALTKLQQMLPSRIRHRISAFHATTVALAAPGSAAERVDPDLLTALAAACRDERRVRLRYPGRDGVTVREVEPHRLVHTPRRWYLVAWDLGRADWRTFRVDRIAGPPGPPGARFAPRPLPADDVAAYVSQSIASAPYRYQARILFRAPLADVAAVTSPAAGRLEAAGPQACILHTGSNSLDELALFVGLKGFDFGVLDPPELAPVLLALSARLRRGADVSLRPGQIRRRTATTLPTMVAWSPRIGV
jgi:predicted DNA-binding transcriptional regulator YafY